MNVSVGVETMLSSEPVDLSERVMVSENQVDVGFLAWQCRIILGVEYLLSNFLEGTCNEKGILGLLCLQRSLHPIAVQSTAVSHND